MIDAELKTVITSSSGNCRSSIGRLSAMVDGETTCKYYFPEQHHIRLQPANSSMALFLVSEDATDFQILGVIGVYRRV